MSQVRYFCDEHIDKDLAEAVGNREPAIQFVYVGDSGAPPRGTLDPDLLSFAESERMLILTGDRKTFRDHASEHQRRGRHTWGLFCLKRGATWARLIEDLILVWSAATAEEWQDRVEFIPW